jgi:hypothetical protein
MVGESFAGLAFADSGQDRRRQGRARQIARYSAAKRRLIPESDRGITAALIPVFSRPPAGCARSRRGQRNALA